MYLIQRNAQNAIQHNIRRNYLCSKIVLKGFFSLFTINLNKIQTYCDKWDNSGCLLAVFRAIILIMSFSEFVLNSIQRIFSAQLFIIFITTIIFFKNTSMTRSRSFVK